MTAYFRRHSVARTYPQELPLVSSPQAALGAYGILACFLLIPLIILIAAVAQ